MQDVALKGRLQCKQVYVALGKAMRKTFSLLSSLFFNCCVPLNTLSSSLYP